MRLHIQIIAPTTYTVIALSLLMLSATASGQQPFYTDDADVTPRGHVHFEVSNEFDLLQRSSFPNLKQNTLDFELDYGVFNGVEVGFEAPVLTIFNAMGRLPRNSLGIGDSNISLKYNFRVERENSRVPAMAIALNLELPTGNKAQQLGSGLADYYLNGIMQKSLGRKTKIRVNGGILFSGNTTTGVIGIKTRGTVFTGGGSVVKQLTPKFDFGIELTGAVAKNFQLGKGQLQTLLGGNYALSKRVTLDFGVVAGKYVASPRAGAQLGLSLDW